jgi:large subunit ribosomal protein L19
MLDLIRRITLARSPNRAEENFSSGDTIEVHVKVKEGEKERIQIFRGTVIRMHGSGVSRSFTVRKMSDGIGVERTFPLASPVIDKVKVIAHGRVRRSKLYYLRGLRGKAARIDFELTGGEAEKVVKPAAPQA